MGELGPAKIPAPCRGVRLVGEAIKPGLGRADLLDAASRNGDLMYVGKVIARHLIGTDDEAAD